MMFLPAKLISLATFGKLSEESRMWRTFTGDDRQGKSDRYAKGCVSSAAEGSAECGFPFIQRDIRG